MEHYELTSLWKNAFDPKEDGLNEARSILKIAYQEFRARVSFLLQQIQKELPVLTLHDITHVDSLWRIASEIAGHEYCLNPAEAFVLGGAFLLHDAAHCRAAFPGGLKEIEATTEWRDVVSQRGFTNDDLIEGAEAFQSVLFDVLRVLHPKQAKKLPFAKWTSSDGECLYLLPHDDLRGAYGHIIGEIAESHWWYPHELVSLVPKKSAIPPCLAPANWTVDIFKLAVLLRTADAAHVDAKRAPRLLMLMNSPQGISKEHWQFQARLNQPSCDVERGELFFSGSPFPKEELSAWWLAYDAACLADKELAAADMLFRDYNAENRLAARSVEGTHSPSIFAKHVPTDGWHPVDTNIKIRDIKSVVERFGGEKLYGKDPSAAIRELLQNAVDAVHACRSLGGLSAGEGEIEVALDEDSNGHWLHITDTGIGMSRYVMTEVLLDFGGSLWRSPDLRGEWSGLTSAGFEAIGQFGIGFFSVFMLGEKVWVTSRRYEPKEGEASQWLLEFNEGPSKRPILRSPIEKEKLKKHGTRISVLITQDKLNAICKKQLNWQHEKPADITLAQACARLAPALDMNLYVRIKETPRQHIVVANDWLTLPSPDLLRRIIPGHLDNISSENFGFWSHLSEIRNNSGDVIGRCAVQPFTFWGPNPGIGVIKGILAGTVYEMAGIILSKPQSDLARKEVIPDISLTEIQLWADTQKNILIKNNRLQSKQSGLLANFGASYTGLTLGQLGGVSVSYEEFISATLDMSEIIIHDGDVHYDDNDDVLQKDFDDFEADDCLLELTSQRAPGWLDQADDNEVSREFWSLESALKSALKKAWGQIYLSDIHIAVGEVNGTEIIRSCRIARRDG